MTTTQSTVPQVKIAVDQGLLLAQVTAPLGGSKYRVGKLAYDFINATKAKSAEEIRDVVSKLGLPSISERDLRNETEAALAVASAAILDSSRGRRLTVTEQLERAMDYLDDELSAGW